MTTHNAQLAAMGMVSNVAAMSNGFSPILQGLALFLFFVLGLFAVQSGSEVEMADHQKVEHAEVAMSLVDDQQVVRLVDGMAVVPCNFAGNGLDGSNLAANENRTGD